MTLPTQEDRGRFYWVDRLSVFSVLRLAVLTIITRRAKSQTVFYLSASRIGTGLLQTLSVVLRVFRSRIASHEQDYDLYDLRSDDEGPTTYEIDLQIDGLQKRVGQIVVENIDLKSLISRRLKRPYNQEKVRLFLVQSIANEIRDDVLNLSVIHRLATKTGHAHPSQSTILLRRSAFSHYIAREHPALSEFRVEWYEACCETNLVLRALIGLARQFVLALVGFFVGLRLRWAVGGQASVSNTAQRPRIAVSHTQGPDLDALSDLFWFPHSRIPADLVMVYFNRKRYPPTKEALEQLSRLEMEWLLPSEWRPGQGDFRYVLDMFAVLLALLRLVWSLPFSRFHPKTWKLRAAIEMERRVRYWSAFLRTHNVAVHIHHVANTHNAIPMVFAAEDAGAIDFGYQWSGSEFLRSVRSRITASHVYFAWGEGFAAKIRQNSLLPDTILIGGNVFDYLGLSATGRSTRTRKWLTGNGCDYVICLFDSGYQRAIHQTPKLMAEFYTTVLEWALNDRSLGLVIKPRASAQDRLPGVRPLVDELIARGQCVVLDSGVTSFEAARSADIAVGVGINTAVLDAALAGVPGVHLDLPGMVKGYVGLDRGTDSFVFRDSGELRAAIEKHRSSGGNTDLGDHGVWLDSVDPFQDGKAAQRMGNYLRWYLESIEAGHDSKQAVAEATARYSREVGSQYVLSTKDQPIDTPPQPTR